MKDFFENAVFTAIMLWFIITFFGMIYGTSQAKEWPELTDPKNNVCMGIATHLSTIFPGAKWGCWIGSPVGFHLWDNKLRPLK